MAYTPPNITASATGTPSIHLWNRLEPRPRSKELNRSLRAEVRDASWLLSRQWQVGEYEGEDRASLAFAHIEMETRAMPYYWAGTSESSQLYNQEDRPLEAIVEGEPFPIDYGTRVAMAEYWIKVIRRTGLQWSRSVASYRRALAEWQPVAFAPLPTVPPESDADKLTYFTACTQNDSFRERSTRGDYAFDGYKLYNTLRSEQGALPLFYLTNEFVVINNTDIYKNCVHLFVSWVDRTFGFESQPAWIKQNLEYKFKLGIARDGAEFDLLEGDEYSGQHLDWYSLDVARGEGTMEDPKEEPLASRPSPAAISGLTGFELETFMESVQPRQTSYSFLPLPIQFASTPNARWWEFEDRRLDFSAITGDSSDVGRMMLMEFSLLYSTDWHYFPYTVPVGTLNQVKRLFVTDVFGARYQIFSSGALSEEGRELLAEYGQEVLTENDWGQWALFSQSEKGKTYRSSPSVFIAPSVMQPLESKPIEKVQLLRDEMANLVWAIEHIVPDGMGTGMDGHKAARTFKDLLLASESGGSALRPDPTVNQATALQYQLTFGTVPENWIPFLPVPQQTTSDIYFDVRLEVGAMPREGLTTISANSPLAYVEPRTSILDELAHPTPQAAAIYEEEVSREGIIVTKAYQRARWYDGKVVVWLGRRKETGRGEGSSGIEFDRVAGLNNVSQASS